MSDLRMGSQRTDLPDAAPVGSGSAVLAYGDAVSWRARVAPATRGAALGFVSSAAVWFLAAHQTGEATLSDRAAIDSPLELLAWVLALVVPLAIGGYCAWRWPATAVLGAVLGQAPGVLVGLFAGLEAAGAGSFSGSDAITLGFLILGGINVAAWVNPVLLLTGFAAEKIAVWVLVRVRSGQSETSGRP